MSEPFWTPLGGQPVDYEGAWAAGTAYAPGDVVLYNGVYYVAVNPSQGSTPPAFAPATGAGIVPLVTALPASPFDGQEVIFTDSLTAPTYQWRLRYVAAKASNRWIYLGGAPMRAVVGADGVDQTTSAFSATDLATPGPGITVPLTGLYRLAERLRISSSAAGNWNVTYYKVGAAAAVEIARLQAGGAHIFMVQTVDITAAAGDLVKIQYAVSAGTGYFSYRQIEVEPIAVGG